MPTPSPPFLPSLNATLNATAALLLLLGRWLIARHRERAHRNAMLAAFGVSVLFLASYLYYHFSNQVLVRYQGPAWGRIPYLTMLLSHTLLAAAVPVLALRTIWLAWRGRRAAHRRWARWTFPLWLYVSVTGVLIYLVLYQWTDSGALALGLTGAKG